MKLLLDENLSRRLVPSLQAVYPGSSQVDLLDLSGANDHAVWTYARAHDFAIVTKDDDYLDLSAHFGPPPLVIRLVMGNCSNARVLATLCDQHAAIADILNRGRPVGVIELG